MPKTRVSLPIKQIDNLQKSIPALEGSLMCLAVADNFILANTITIVGKEKRFVAAGATHQLPKYSKRSIVIPNRCQPLHTRETVFKKLLQQKSLMNRVPLLFQNPAMTVF